MLVNGQRVERGTISAVDIGFTRGVGGFEVARSYGGKILGLERHLDRLEITAASVGMELAPREALARWLNEMAAEGGDCLVRMLCSPGDEGADPVPTTVVHWFPLRSFPETMRLSTTVAHWHPAGIDWELAGAKTLSYAPNMAALDAAIAAGFDDTVLVSVDSVILECPRSGFGWVRDGAIEFPSLDLGVLDSITRQFVEEIVVEVGYELRTGVFDVSVLEDATEAFILSTAKEVASVVQVGDVKWEAGPITRDLITLFGDRVRAEIGG